MSTSAVISLPLFRTDAHILRLPFELWVSRQYSNEHHHHLSHHHLTAYSNKHHPPHHQLHIIISLKLRSLHLHPPRLCRLAVFLINSRAIHKIPVPYNPTYSSQLLQCLALKLRSLRLQPPSFVSQRGILIQTIILSLQ